MRKVRLKTIPTRRDREILQFVLGARAVLNEITTDSDDPVEVVFEANDGQTEIFLIYGKWVGAHQAHFPGYEHLDWQI